PEPCWRMRGGGSPAAAVASCSATDIALPKSVSGSRPANCDLPCDRAASTSRVTCWRGVMPSGQTPGRPCAGSLVKASTATPAFSATEKAGDLGRGERPEDQLGAAGDRRLRRGRRALRRAGGVAHVEARGVRAGEGELGALEQRLRDV